MDMEDESDDSSSPIETLDQFRDKWHKELNTTKCNHAVNQKQTTTGSDNVNDDNNTDDVTAKNQQAESLFMQGVELEKKGKVFEAMLMYRRAVHIDSDIEFKMYDKLKATIHKGPEHDSLKNSHAGDRRNDDDDDDDDEDDEDLSSVDLRARFHASIANGNDNLFSRDNVDNGVIVTDGYFHISNLPTEIVLYILRWVVSGNLDLRSLEQCSMVSKGFYLLARDPEIWRLACFKVWGHNIDTLKASKYTSWRQMFIECPRVCFNGCYISKTSYLRYGERSFQDQFYRPVHLIEYYRYVRFFPDRTVLVLTSTDEPAHIVGKLQNGKHRPDVLKGNYKFLNDIVTVIVRKNKTKESSHREERMRAFTDYERDQSTFYLQFLMSYTRKRQIPQLEWKKYSIMQKKDKYQELWSDFDLKPNIYPALKFSRVKSYDSISYQHL